MEWYLAKFEGKWAGSSGPCSRIVSATSNNGLGFFAGGGLDDTTP